MSGLSPFADDDRSKPGLDAGSYPSLPVALASGSGAVDHAGKTGTPIGSPMPLSPSDLGRSPSTSTTSSGTATGASVGARDRFEADELREITAKFDIGKILAIREFRRGSSRSPKVVVQTNRGEFLLKRRSEATLGSDGLARVRLCHAVQSLLAAKKFPLPVLMPTRDDWMTVLRHKGSIYELFSYLPGNAYDGSLDGTGDAGMLLAGFHALLAGQEQELSKIARLPMTHYHRAPGLSQSLDRINELLGEPVRRVVQRLRLLAEDAARRVDDLGLPNWPMTIIHGDWHPGNMLFAGPRVIAVIDYDTIRVAPRMIDIANGALQFSLIFNSGSEKSPWATGLDEARFKRFIRGYETVKDSLLSEAEILSMPWLMIEAIIVEAAAPISLTGRFGRLDGPSFLQIVDEKAAWLAQHSQRLTSLALG